MKLWCHWPKTHQICRLLTSRTQPSGFFAFDEEHSAIRFDVPPESGELLGPNNSKHQYDFRFDGLFGLTAKQEDVFEAVAMPAVENTLAGYNATIFAYGQTGSGKTFTITGGPHRYEDRGIIPRALQMIFQRCAAARKAGGQATVWISYLEIYNEQGYDLLEESSTEAVVPGTHALDELPRVSIREDEYGNVHLGNLSLHRAETEEEALNLLFQGDTNRAICETPMNPVSSRSHCVFTVSVEQREDGSPVVKRSKLNLVDLAGSERAYKTGVTGTLFREATHINTSLLALRRVIDSLHTKSTKRGSKTHVPYRDSTITSVLRDSLGGNCKTAVVATVSAEAGNTDESISTCRFAQGVARIRNDASVNLETDPAVLVARLREQVQLLQAQKDLALGESGAETSIAEDEKVKIAASTEAWARAGPDPERPPEDRALPDIGGFSIPRLEEAFRVLRKMARTASASDDAGTIPKSGISSDAAAQIRELKQSLAQRNHEIAALVNIARDLRGKHGVPSASPAHATDFAVPAGSAAPTTTAGVRLPHGEVIEWHALSDKDATKEQFKAGYSRRDQLREAKRELAAKYGDAKAAAGLVEGARAKIGQLKAAIEDIRVKAALQTLASSEAGESPSGTASDTEQPLRAEMEAQQHIYNLNMAKLRQLKTEIEYGKKLYEAGMLRLQTEFESWYATALLEMKTRHDAATAGRARGGAPAAAIPVPRASASASQAQLSGPIGAPAGGVESEELARFYAARDQLRRMTGK